MHALITTGYINKHKITKKSYNRLLIKLLYQEFMYPKYTFQYAYKIIWHITALSKGSEKK